MSERWLLWEDTDTMVVDIVQNVMVQEIVIIQDVLMMEHIDGGLNYG